MKTTIRSLILAAIILAVSSSGFAATTGGVAMRQTRASSMQTESVIKTAQSAQLSQPSLWDQLVEFFHTLAV